MVATSFCLLFSCEMNLTYIGQIINEQIEIKSSLSNQIGLAILFLLNVSYKSILDERVLLF